MSRIDDIKFNLNANVYANDGDGIAREDVTYLLSENERLQENKSEEESEYEHNKSLLALEQEIEGWKSANRILKARLEITQKALEKISHNAYLDVAGEDAKLMLMMSGNIADEALRGLT